LSKEERMNKTRAPRQVSRREFIKGAAGVAGVAAVGTLASCVPVTPAAPARPTPEVQVWDKEADIVVLGTGTVCPAALVAHEAGAKVLILEKGTEFGGTTRLSGGGLWMPNNYLMKQAGVVDSRDMALTYLRRVADGQAPEELIVAYVDRCNEMLEWLRDNCGFQWQRSASPTPAFADYYPFEGAVKGTRQVSILREDNVGAGAGLSKSLKEAIDARAIETMLQTPGKRLVTNSAGEVIGVIAESGGKEIAIKASRAVIIGTGGFEHNRELVLHYLRAPLHAANSVTANTGDGLLMGIAVGADLRNMNECWGLPFFKPVPDAYSGIADWQLWRGKPGTVVVNKHGERIGNESAAYDASEKAFHTYDTGTFEWRNIPSFCIFDSGYTQNYALPGAAVGAVPAWITKADTLDALAAALGIDAAGLKSTIDIFNKNARDGVDPVWHRGEADFDRWTAGDLKRTDLKNPCLAPLETPPYYGATIWPGTCGTNGGLRTNANAQVLDVWGNVLPRLYCSGNTMASVMGVGYAGGGSTIGPGLTFGYIAGKHAASLMPWE
jgi:3-oxosteroid 1-dehydrogenase